MKKMILTIVLLLAAILSGCGGGSTDISADRAKEIALENAGAKAEDVKFARVEKDRDDGRAVYEVEFYTSDGTEYDYEIDAETGEIVSYDSEIESRRTETLQSEATVKQEQEAVSETPKNAEGEGTTQITADKAKEIALAKVPGATLENIVVFETDREDGKNVYEGKIIYDKTEYEFEIDAQTGNVNEWESESIYD